MGPFEYSFQHMHLIREQGHMQCRAPGAVAGLDASFKGTSAALVVSTVGVCATSHLPVTAHSRKYTQLYKKEKPFSH